MRWFNRPQNIRVKNSRKFRVHYFSKLVTRKHETIEKFLSIQRKSLQNRLFSLTTCLYGTVNQIRRGNAALILYRKVDDNIEVKLSIKSFTAQKPCYILTLTYQYSRQNHGKKSTILQKNTKEKKRYFKLKKFSSSSKY